MVCGCRTYHNWITACQHFYNTVSILLFKLRDCSWLFACLTILPVFHLHSLGLYVKFNFFGWFWRHLILLPPCYLLIGVASVLTDEDATNVEFQEIRYWRVWESVDSNIGTNFKRLFEGQGYGRWARTSCSYTVVFFPWGENIDTWVATDIF